MLLAFVPTPLWIIAPGTAVDLSHAVEVARHAPSRDRYYLTDVTLQPATVLLLPLALIPGVRLVRQDTVVPKGIAPARYDRILADAMDESQGIAAVVAERAAGLHVPLPPEHVFVGAILPTSAARGTLRVGDEVVSLGGTRVFKLGQVLGLVSAVAPGATLPISVRRGERRLDLHVRTMRLLGGTRLGVMLEPRTERPVLPVPVHFTLNNISGSSGGLMFALAIYSALRGDRLRPAMSIAGTGTLGYDGRIGPIEGTRQKLIAAKRVGARIFFVPRENYTEVASEHDVRVVPVGTFGEALAALRS